MNDDRPPPAPSVRGSISWGMVFLGLAIFGVGNFFYVLRFAGDEDLALPALGLGLATLVLTGVAFALSRGLALGVIAGYGVMTIVSGGACTLLRPMGEYGEEGALVGLLLYPAAVVVFGIVALARYYLASRGRSDE